MAEPTLTLSVVVISWNQIALLQTLIGQLLDQTLDPDCYEVIIVDHGSTDGSRQWCSGLSDRRVRLCLNSSNRGRAAARNDGIRAAGGRIVVMIDGDHTVNRDFLSIHSGRHTENWCAIVGRSEFADQAEYRALSHYLNRGGAAKVSRDARLPGRYFLTRNCSVPREALVQLGLFDERFERWGGEDVDLGVKLEEAGVPIFAEPRAVAIHHHFRPLAPLLQSVYEFGRDGIPILLERHPQLFTELNLDRTLKNPKGPTRFGAVYRTLMSGLMSEPFYIVVRVLAHALHRRRLPRIVFDYLHLRQYTCGYRASLRPVKENAVVSSHH